MTNFPPSKPTRPVPAARLLRPQTRIDLILEVDYFTGHTDVRNSIILDLTPQKVILAQTSPPILKSMIGREVEATIVHHNLITYEAIRWGWTAAIRGLDGHYKLDPDDPEAQPIHIVELSRPDRAELQKSNARQAYRLEASGREGIAVTIQPEIAPVWLINFSAGGLMLGTPPPPAYTLGQELAFQLTFPAEAPLPVNLIKGQATVVRQEFDRGDKSARLGLQFHELSQEGARALPKIINYYMLEEQRRRNRDEG